MYDPNGRGNLYGEYFSASSFREYAYLDDIPVASATDARVAAPGISYLYADHLGTLRSAMTASGTSVYAWPWLNNAFGDQPSTGTTPYYLGFPGQYYDVETGLNFNNARHYDSGTGR